MILYTAVGQREQRVFLQKERYIYDTYLEENVELFKLSFILMKRKQTKLKTETKS